MVDLQIPGPGSAMAIAAAVAAYALTIETKWIWKMVLGILAALFAVLAVLIEYMHIKHRERMKDKELKHVPGSNPSTQRFRSFSRSRFSRASTLKRTASLMNSLRLV